MAAPRKALRPPLGGILKPPLNPALPVCLYAGRLRGPGDLQTHMHRGLELGIVLENAEEFVIGGHRFVARAGDVWLCGMWEPHSWRLPKGETSQLVFTFLPESVDQTISPDHSWMDMFAAPPELRPRVTTREMRERVLDTAQSLLREVMQERPAWHVIVRLELLRLLVELNRSWQAPGQSDRSAGARIEVLERIMPAVRLVQPHLKQRVRVEDAARLCSLSVSRFHFMFQQAMGTSFGRFHLRSRIGFAAHRLLTTSLPVDVIAKEEGFADASHLHRNFLRQCGCTPAHYRKQGKLAPEWAHRMLPIHGLILAEDTPFENIH